MDAVVALLRYVAPQAQPLHTYAYDSPDGAPRFNGTLVEHAMSIHDARGLGHGTEFQGLGFTLTEHRSDVVHFDSDRQVIDIGYPEAEMLVRRVRADTVFIHDDSARAHGAVTGACPHTAFEHPLTPAGVAPRQSIELRALAWYEDCA